MAEIKDTTFAIRCIFPLYQYRDDYDFTRVVSYKLDAAKRELAIRVFEEVFANGPVVLDSHIEEWRDFENIYYTLHYRMTRVHTRNIELPVFTFVNHEGKQEWKCPACGTINIMDATFCGELHNNARGCGRSRDKIRQEI